MKILYDPVNENWIYKKIKTKFMNNTIDINDLAKDLGLTRQNLNYHINKGRAGEVEKNGYARTSSLIIEPKNVITLIDWLGSYGRSDKLLLDSAYKKYSLLVEE